MPFSRSSLQDSFPCDFDRLASGLMELSDACGENLLQAVLVSHHPELLDYLGPEYGLWIERDPLGPARVKRLSDRVHNGLKLSEGIARQQ